MKACSVCGILKESADFFFRNKHTETLHSQCKQCYTTKRQKTWQDYYYKHGSKYRENAVERNRKAKNILRLNMLDYLSDKSCAVCGIKDRRVLEFDHIDPALKSFSIARGITCALSWSSILIEIKKCQVLCANCHKIKTGLEQNWYRNT